jgi:acetyl-CoA acetyltransferase
MIDLGGAAAIAGYGDAYATTDDPRSYMQLAAEALKSVLAKTSLPKSAIGAVFTGRTPVADQRPQWNNVLSSYFQLTPEYGTEVTTHGAGVNGALAYASLFTATGLVDYALILVTDNAGTNSDHGRWVAATDADPEFEYPYGPSVPSIYAQTASRYMYEFGVSPETLAEVAVQHQEWAIGHPYAAKGQKGPITVETVLNSRLIADPIRLWNAATFGPYGTAGALLVTSAERARDLTDIPISIRGYGSLNTHEYSTDRLSLTSSRFDLGPLPNTTWSGARHSAARAFSMAGLTPDDVDVVECGNNFTHIAMILMEDFGFCEKGRASDLVASGRLRPGGNLPWNTNGGWLSFGQPGISCGMDPIIEAVRQLRGEALGIQVKNPRIALTHALGGMLACHHVTILSR